MIFENRHEAGKQLAAELVHYRNEQPIILALPRGGIPIGFEIAEVLHAPLDVLVARKIGAPHNPEFGIGAIAEGNVKIFDEPSLNQLGISKKELEEEINKENEELKRRVALYRNNEPLPRLEDRIVLLVDDGLATGITALAGIISIKKKHPKQIIFASPVCDYGTAQELGHLVTQVICITKPVNFTAVGFWYRNFTQLNNKEVVKLLEESRKGERPAERFFRHH